MDESIPCPQCGAPAQITERFWLGSTAGPVEHVKTGCANQHWLTPLAQTLTSAQPTPPQRPPSPHPPEPARGRHTIIAGAASPATVRRMQRFLPREATP